MHAFTPPPPLNHDRAAAQRWPAARRALAGAALFAAGWAFAAVAPFATSINRGLVQAFDSVGKNLFGSAVFGSIVVPPNATAPAGAVQVEFATDTRIRTAVGLFAPAAQPVDPCRRVVQFVVVPTAGAPSLALHYDASLVTAMPLQDTVPVAPNVARCSAPPPTGD